MVNNYYESNERIFYFKSITLNNYELVNKDSDHMFCLVSICGYINSCTVLRSKNGQEKGEISVSCYRVVTTVRAW